MDLTEAFTAVKSLRPWLRPFLAPRLPEIQKLRNWEQRAKDCLEPVIQQRQIAEKNDPNWEKPNDMLQWMITRLTAQNAPLDTSILMKNQLALIFVAVHTTSMAATNTLYSLAVTPEYVGPLREEIRAVMAEHNGELSTQAVHKLVKMDSYLKEVMRLNPPNITSFNRKVLKSFTLSNGQHIPKGVNIAVPSSAVYLDPEIHPDGDTFNGFRHYNQRVGSVSSQARNQFVFTNEENTAFGLGNHSCPGRFFATNELKLILARIILDFDIKMPDGLTERYKQLEFGKRTTPDPSKKLLFRKVVHG
ncbi:hypothetical protein J4E91_010930 [Alternaria rosae]|nr:hypothetical protein J4E91_010930 [Alternaria rosae]